eukprot:UN14254
MSLSYPFERLIYIHQPEKNQLRYNFHAQTHMLYDYRTDNIPKLYTTNDSSDTKNFTF